MSENRRRSTRKAAVKNAEGVLKRLKESEVRRAKMATPTVKIVHKITQEERLKEAVITEKKNVESLNTFYQQEEDRRKLRRAALLAKRAPMTSFIRYVSKTTYFEPSPIQPLIQEIPVESQKSLVKRDSKRKRKQNKSLQLLVLYKMLKIMIMMIQTSCSFPTPTISFEINHNTILHTLISMIHCQVPIHPRYQNMVQM